MTITFFTLTYKSMTKIICKNPQNVSFATCGLKKKKFRNCGCLVYLLISQRDFHSRNYGWLVTNISLQSVKTAGFSGVNPLVLLVPSSPVLSSSSTVISHFSQQWSPFSLYNTWCSLKATFRMRRTSKALTSVKEGGVNTRRGDEEPHLIRAVAGKI